MAAAVPVVKRWWLLGVAALGWITTLRGDGHLAVTDTGVVSRPGPGPTSIRTTGTYRGWTNAFFLARDPVWLVVVPAVGRVMQFGRVDTPGVFWVNDALAGKAPFPNPWSVAGSFGGDKTWPAPQSDWNWPPPEAFDAEPVEAVWDGDAVVMTTRVSPRFGFRARRRVELVPGADQARIVTTYEAVDDVPREVSVWVITQMMPPEGAYLPVPAGSRFADGLAGTWEVPEPFLHRGEGWIRMDRDPAGGHKIGNDAETLLWVGRDAVVRIDCPRIPGTRYPDDGCSAEIYTNGDPAAYIELETLGPVRRLQAGGRLTATNLYTLYPRTEPDADAEARRHLRRP